MADTSGSLPGGTFGVHVVMDPVAIANMIRSPDGFVMRELMRDGQRVKREAQRRVGVYRPPPAGPRRARKPGTLRDSIVVRMVNRGGKVSVEVGSDDEVALLHHEGTQPHPIVARNAPRLVFWSARAGRVVVAKRVNHPGTRPNRYLTDSLSVIRSR